MIFSGSKILNRKLSTAFRVLQNEGLGRLFEEVGRSFGRVRTNRQSKLEASVSLDGCTFTLKGISSVSMRRELLNSRYENFERRAAMAHVSPDYPVIELGACIGVVACITNRILRNPSNHVVVEASPSVIPLLEENRRRNHCQFEVRNQAIAYDQTAVTFADTSDYWGNSITRERSENMVTVPATTLRQIVEEKGFDTFTLICDIEGHEYDLVQQEADAVRRAHTIILETHARMIGEAKTLELLENLHSMGFEQLEKDSFVCVLRRSQAAVPNEQLAFLA